MTFYEVKQGHSVPFAFPCGSEGKWARWLHRMKSGDCRTSLQVMTFFLPISILTAHGLEIIEMHSCKVKSKLPIKGQTAWWDIMWLSSEVDGKGGNPSNISPPRHTPRALNESSFALLEGELLVLYRSQIIRCMRQSMRNYWVILWGLFIYLFIHSFIHCKF